MEGPIRIKYIGAALPAISATVNLFSSVVSFPFANAFQSLGLNRLYITIANDRSGTLKAYQSVDRGVTWVQVFADVTVAIATTNDENRYDYLVEPYADFKVDFVNDATAQTKFNIQIAAVRGERNVGT